MYSDMGVVILAAGLGTRMKSDKAKVLHEICRKPMIYYVTKTAKAVFGDNVYIVTGHQAEQVRKAVESHFKATFVLQEQQLGTGHAVLCAMPFVSETIENLVILCGDVPLISATTIKALINEHQRLMADVTVLAVTVENPTGYGRIVFNDEGRLSRIVEEADANDLQKKIKIINTGIYVAKRVFLDYALPKIGKNNAQKEMYLTDIIGVGYQEKRKIGVFVGEDDKEIIGVNSSKELQQAENIMKSMIS